MQSEAFAMMLLISTLCAGLGCVAGLTDLGERIERIDVPGSMSKVLLVMLFVASVLAVTFGGDLYEQGGTR